MSHAEGCNVLPACAQQPRRCAARTDATAVVCNTMHVRTWRGPAQKDCQRGTVRAEAATHTAAGKRHARAVGARWYLRTGGGSGTAGGRHPAHQCRCRPAAASPCRPRPSVSHTCRNGTPQHVAVLAHAAGVATMTIVQTRVQLGCRARGTPDGNAGRGARVSEPGHRKVRGRLRNDRRLHLCPPDQAVVVCAPADRVRPRCES